MFPSLPAAAWTAALVVPMVLEVALIGTVLHDADDGASLWLAGEIFVLVQALPIHLAATTGTRLGRRHAERVRS